MTVDELLRIRDNVRWSEFGKYEQTGGGCAIVSESVMIVAAGGSTLWMTGYEPVGIDAGCYVTSDGKHIAHVWNVLPSGRILDVTADQFNDGANVRITEADDHRYVLCGCGDNG